VPKSGPDKRSKRRGPEEHSRHLEAAGVFEKLLDGLNVGIANVLPSGKVLYCNDRFRKVLFIPSQIELAGHDLRYTLTPESWPEVMEALRESTQRPVEGELRIEAEGRTHFVSLSLTPLPTSNPKTIRIVATEKTELVETSKALDQSQAELQSLSAKILQLRDNERRRIARDLHDVTGQELAVVLMTLGSVSTHLNGDANVRERLKEATDILRKVENEIRTLSYLLHPPLLDESGLSAALQWYVQGLEKRAGLHVHAEFNFKLPRLTRDREIALFRVIQESLTNVIRHAEATEVWVRAIVREQGLELTVEDNGRGISPEQISLAGRGLSEGVGIAGMDQRLRQLGGRLRVTPTGHGTRVTASAPIGEGNEEETASKVEAKRAAPAKAVSSSNRKRILIADDHEVTRRGICALLAEEKDFEICGEASNGLDAVTKAFGLQPDLIILDLIMPKAGGLNVANQLRRGGLKSGILVFTTHSFPGIEKTLQAAGCDGYVLKQDASEELVQAAREVLRGASYFHKSAGKNVDVET
jgi:two-component system NarL family sensor kinase